jgi:hypothetical protein
MGNIIQYLQIPVGTINLTFAVDHCTDLKVAPDAAAVSLLEGLLYPLARDIVRRPRQGHHGRAKQIATDLV